MNGKIKTLFNRLYGDNILRIINRTPRILVWHSVDQITDNDVEAETINVDAFELQVDYLRSHFEIISIDEFYLRYKNKTFTNREIVLTFDDGYRNNLYKVVPILNKYSMPFTVFISTDHILTGEPFPTSIVRLIILGANIDCISIPLLGLYNIDIKTKSLKKEVCKQVNNEIKVRPLSDVKVIINELINNISRQEYNRLQNRYRSVKPMTWDEVKEIHKLGVTVGSHSKSHICCHKNQNNDEIKTQIMESKTIIENELDAECRYFAYPNGDYTEFSNNCVREAGYLMAFTTQGREHSLYDKDIFSVPRIVTVRDYDTFKIITNLYPLKLRI